MPVKTVVRQQSQTPAQQLQQQRQRDVENGLYPNIPPERRSPPSRPQTLRQDTIDMEEIPLNQTISQEPEDRRKMREVFDKHDSDRDGLISTHELKELISDGYCRDIPAYIAEQILRRSDVDNNGHLDFEEFYTMSLHHKWMVRNILARYCRYVVPPPKPLEGDEPDGAYEKQMSICPPPLTMVIFSIIEIIMFLVDVIHFQDDPNHNDRLGESTSGPAATLFIYNPYKRYEAWRFVSYMFVHVGIMHLMMNLIIQIFLGIALELVHHWWRVALVYLAGVLAGSMGTSLTSPRIFLAGASGGVYALITAHIATIIMNYSEMEYAIVQLLAFLVFCFTDLGTSVYRHLTDQHDQIGYVAHLSGAVAGLLVGIGVLRNLEVRRWERILWWVAVIFYFALMTTGIIIHIFVPDYFPKQEYN
ncbi:GL26733 [Drosophila persimilis]|uniref:GL26733 n=1 Tax=Drosophila persimilis TaxID=7234 RepID=B4H2T4_DROPE|nr:protein rhomboid isoform X1 [Drosophila persimilis]XP_017146959.1 protein rhomboid [Drosophila miranda]EDW30651.1 GL26733 [Drosophila persimilis]